MQRWFKILLFCLPLLWVFGWKRWSVAFSHTLVAAFIGTALFLILENRGSPKLKLLRSSAGAFFAKTSYAAYLTHHVIAYLTFVIADQPRTVTTLSGVGLTIASFLATFGLCAFSYRYFEEPLLRYGHNKFKFGAKTGAIVQAESLSAAG